MWSIKADAAQLPVRTLPGARVRRAAAAIEFDRSYLPRPEYAKVYDELPTRFS